MLEIIKTNTTQQSKEVINNCTVFYTYVFEGNQPPIIISFSVIRGIEGDPNYNGTSAITGTFRNGSFETKNSDYQPTDAALLSSIHTTCNSLVNPE